MADYGVTENGFVIPSQNDIQTDMRNALLDKIGSDIDVSDGAFLGQVLGVVSEYLSKGWEGSAAGYNAFNISSSYGTNLSSLVSLNALERIKETYSIVTLTLKGTKGTIIPAGNICSSIDSLTVITTEEVVLVTGSVTVQAQCTIIGAVDIPAGIITEIDTPIAGWDSVTNIEDGKTGNNRETDPELKTRHELSTGINAVNTSDSIHSLISTLSTVQYVRVYENDANTTDPITNTPRKSIQVIVVGGDDTEIAKAIYEKKSEGTLAYGNTKIMVTNISGFPHGISFTRPVQKPLYIVAKVERSLSYSSTLEDDIKDNIIDFIENGSENHGNYGVGDNIPIKALSLPIQATTGVYYCDYLSAGTSSQATSGEIEIAYNEIISIDRDNITITFI